MLLHTYCRQFSIYLGSGDVTFASVTLKVLLNISEHQFVKWKHDARLLGYLQAVAG